MEDNSDPIFFWSASTDTPTQNCMSQWYRCYFTIQTIEEQITFTSAEMYMMYRKAKLFGDDFLAYKMLEIHDPRMLKQLGREVRNFKPEVWDIHKLSIVTLGNIFKFSQNADLKGLLLATKGRLLVEASPYDSVWGIGLAEKDAKATPQNQWPGQNLLGIALMEARTVLGS